MNIQDLTLHTLRNSNLGICHCLQMSAQCHPGISAGNTNNSLCYIELLLRNTLTLDTDWSLKLYHCLSESDLRYTASQHTAVGRQGLLDVCIIMSSNSTARVNHDTEQLIHVWSFL